MATKPTDRAADSTAVRPPHTGPVGRLARLLLAAALGWVAYDVWSDRSFIVAQAEPGVLVLTAFAAVGAYYIAGLAGLGKEVLVLIAVGGAVSAVLTAVLEGTLWAAPLSWYVVGLDLVVLVLIVAATIIAVILGTPGCEVGAFRDIARRLRREPGAPDALFCLVGLHRLDAWEARRSWRRSRRGGGQEALK